MSSKTLKTIAGTAIMAAGIVLAPATGGMSIAAAAAINKAAGFNAFTGLIPLLLKSHKSGVSLAQIDRLNASIDPNAPRKIVFGRTAMATDIRYVEPSGTNQEYIDYIVVVASHAVTSIDEIWLEDVLAWTAAGGAQGKFGGYLTVDVRLGGSAANTIAINGGAKWGASRRLTGCAYLHLRIKRTGNSKKAESPFSGGLASRMTIIGDGAKLYDPRRDSMVTGGSGPMRADDQSTWAFAPGGTTIGENHALQTLWYLLGWRINGRLAVGRGADPRRLDLAGWIVAANLCDEAVLRADGSSEPRYAGAGVFSEADEPASVLGTLTAACNGRMREGSGKLGMVIMHNDLASVATDDGLGDDDVLGQFSWNPDPALEQTYNIVRGRYTDPSPASLYQLVPYPEISIPGVDGIDRILQLDLPMTESASRAQRIAKQTLQRKQYQRSFATTFNARGWKYPVGSLVPLSFGPLGFERRTFRVEEQGLPFDGTCPMLLTYEHPAIYAWDREERAAVQAAEPTRYDGLNNPILLAIADAGGAIDTGTNFDVAIMAADAGDGTATVTIAAHHRTYIDVAAVAVAGATLAGLDLATGYWLYYDDPARAGGAVGYVATTIYADAYQSAAAPARHYVGYVVTPGAGSPPAEGDGATPPGGNGRTGRNPIP